MTAKIEIDAEAVGTILRKTTMLAQLNCRRWYGHRQDANAVQDVKAANGAQGDVGQFRKNLLAGADAELKAVAKMQAAAYVRHKQLTLPWMVEGQRLLPASRMGMYLNEINKYKLELQPLVDDFIGKYDQLVDKAKANLGGMFRASEYPHATRVRAAFNLDISLNPIPSTADWQSLSAFDATTLKALGVHTQDKIAEAMRGGVIELRTRAKAWAERAGRSLAPDAEDPSKAAVQFHTTLLTELDRVAEDLHALNVTDERSCQELLKVANEAKYATHGDIKQLRESPSLRDEVRMHADAMLKILADYEEGEGA